MSLQALSGQREDKPSHPHIDHQYDLATRSTDGALSPVDRKNHYYDLDKKRMKVKEEIQARLADYLPGPDLLGLPTKEFGRRE